jgi:hypothetical protein
MHVAQLPQGTARRHDDQTLAARGRGSHVLIRSIQDNTREIVC